MHKYRQVEEAYKQYLKNIVTNIYADKKLVQALSEIFETNEVEFSSRWNAEYKESIKAESENKK